MKVYEFCILLLYASVCGSNKKRIKAGRKEIEEEGSKGERDGASSKACACCMSTLVHSHSFSHHVFELLSNSLSSLALAASSILAFKHWGQRHESTAAGSDSSEGEEEDGGERSSGRERAKGKDAHQHALQSRLTQPQAKAAPHCGQVLLRRRRPFWGHLLRPA
jgi:hypothetical protein